MSTNYTSFAASAFGPAIAEVAKEQFAGKITPQLLRRVRAKLGLTPAAETAVIQRARQILESR